MKSILSWFVLIVRIAVLVSSCAKDDSSSYSTLEDLKIISCILCNILVQVALQTGLETVIY